MKKKSNYLIIALIFIILAMGWQLYIRTQPTEKEKEEQKEEAEKVPEPNGIKIYEKNSHTDKTNLFIGVENVSSFNASCNFILPDGSKNHEYMRVGEGFGFFDTNGESYDIRLLTINNNEYKKEYVIFDIKKGNQLEHPYNEKKKKAYLDEWKALPLADPDLESVSSDAIEDKKRKKRLNRD